MKTVMLCFDRRVQYGQAKLAQVGSVVYVLHPDDPDNILTIPHPTEEAASATFAKVRRRSIESPPSSRSASCSRTRRGGTRAGSP